MALGEDGRRFKKSAEALLLKGEDGLLVVAAPGPGLYRHGPAAGAQVRAGAAIGELEVLGEPVLLRAPQGARGRVVEARSISASREERVARRAVDFKAPLFLLDPKALAGGEAVAEEAADEEAHGPVFRTPLGGRFYSRSTPEAPPFVEPGQLLKGGETVALIEVMKTFNRVTFAADRPARVLKVAVADGEDVRAGDVLLHLVPEQATKGDAGA